MSALQMSDAEAAADPRALICALMRHFYSLGWCSGTGGGISVRQDERIYMAPSGVHKERLVPEHIFELDAGFAVQRAPPCLKLSECAPLFQAAYELGDAGAVLHSHALCAVLATRLPGVADEWRVTGFEMIKGIVGHGNTDTLTVPVVANTEREAELTERLRAALKAYPRTRAVLVRDHGVYVWGATWQQAKAHAEVYHYLFELAWQLHVGGLSAR